ncbi:light harvesting complex photosystem II subunit 6 [Actinidia rufa]|uniref:Chlorophyll a-b binding protein, chloroplastic n=1 Tax=Actinidia rufa TaxID=165716 RepID=A0A7J0EUG8_9ERIC|nr:light harvesting complex photosystem II subunit 6 [Actinidia rufa]
MAATSAAAVLSGLGSPFLSSGKKSQTLLAAAIGTRSVRGSEEVCGGGLPGDYGFDPLGLGKDPTFLKWYREAELIHGRWAMAAVIGIFVGQAWSGIPWFEAGADPGAVAPFSFSSLLGTQLLLMGCFESKRWVNFFNPESQSIVWATPWSRTAENFANATGDQGYPSGKFFDSLCLASTIDNGAYRSSMLGLLCWLC